FGCELEPHFQELRDHLCSGGAILCDEGVFLDQRTNKSLGRILFLLDPAAGHVNKIYAVFNTIGILKDLAAAYRHQRTRRPRLPGDEAVDVTALECREHFGRFDVDNFIVSGIEVPLLDELIPEALAAGPLGDTDLLAFEAVEVLDVAAD